MPSQKEEMCGPIFWCPHGKCTNTISTAFTSIPLQSNIPKYNQYPDLTAHHSDSSCRKPHPGSTCHRRPTDAAVPQDPGCPQLPPCARGGWATAARVNIRPGREPAVCEAHGHGRLWNGGGTRSLLPDLHFLTRSGRTRRTLRAPSS